MLPSVVVTRLGRKTNGRKNGLGRVEDFHILVVSCFATRYSDDLQKLDINELGKELGSTTAWVRQQAKPIN